MVVSRNFLGQGAGLIDGLVLWTGASLALAMPWGFLWSEAPTARIWRVPIGLLISIVPPLGLIGFASPTVAAGILFPGSGYMGFFLALMMPGCMALFPRQTAVIAGGLAVGANIMLTAWPAPPPGWEGVDTFYGGIAHERVDPVLEYQIAEDIKARAIASTASVIVFPESVLPHWTDASDLFWTDTVDQLKSAGKVVLLGVIKRNAGTSKAAIGASLAQLQGASVPPRPVRPESEPTTETYKNAIVIRGASSGELMQRVPVPVGMWRPFTNSGVELRLSFPGTIRIQDKNAAVLICYEQLIPWPALTAFIERPDVIIAVANQFWVSGTAIPEGQQNTVRSWARLFHVPVVFASNR